MGATARAETDAAVVAFRDDVAAKGGETERAYSSAIAAIAVIDGKGSVADLRRVVDGYDGQREITQFNPTADDSFAGYSELVDALADPTTDLSRTIEDADLRTGVILIDLASRQVDRFSWAVRDSLLMVVQGDGHVDEPDEVRKVAVTGRDARRRHAHQRHGDRALRRPGPQARGRQRRHRDPAHLPAGINIRLQATHVGGGTAVVRLPPALLVTDEPPKPHILLPRRQVAGFAPSPVLPGSPAAEVG